MKELWQEIKEHPIASKVVATLIAAVILGVSDYVFLKANVAKAAVQLMDPTIWFWLTVLLGFIVIFLVRQIMLSHPRLVWENELGVWKDRKTGLYYCPKCKGQNKKTPIVSGNIDRHCPVCGWYTVLEVPKQENNSLSDFDAAIELNEKSWLDY